MDTWEFPELALLADVCSDIAPASECNRMREYRDSQSHPDRGHFRLGVARSIRFRVNWNTGLRLRAVDRERLTGNQ